MENPNLRLSIGIKPDQKGVRIRRIDPTAPEFNVLEPSDIILRFDGVDIANDGTENSVGFNTHELTKGLDIGKEVDNSISFNETDHLPELHESLEPERNLKNGRYNFA